MIVAAKAPTAAIVAAHTGTMIRGHTGTRAVRPWNANPGRIRSMHCKEWSKTNGYGAAFGEGDAPWKQILNAAESTGGIEYYLIEQEQSGPGGQFAMAQRCLENWKKLRAA